MDINCVRNFWKNEQVRKLVDKAEFVLFHVITGVVYWILLCFVIMNIGPAIVRYVKSEASIFLYMATYYLVFWFMRMNDKKINWTPFGKHSEMVSAVVVGTVGFLLLFKFGTFKATFEPFWTH